MKYNKIILIIFIFISISDASGQSITFKKVYPGLIGSDPNIYYVSCKPINNDKTFLINVSGMKLIKINEYGTITLTKNYLNYGYINHSIFNNNTLTFYSDLGNYKKLLKLDTSLNVLSSIQYDSINWWQSIDRKVICLAHNAELLLSGGRGILKPVIVKADSLGDILWSKYFTPIQGGIQDIIQTQDSGFAIAMNLKNLGASLVKADKNGNVLWAKSYFRPSGYIHNVLENTDGTMIITGNIDSSLASSPLFFAKLDQSGNIIWAKTFGNTVNNIKCYASCTKQTQDGGYITLATQAKNNNHDDLLLIKTNANGDTLWCRVHGSDSSAEWSFSVEQLNDKGYIIAGGTNDNLGLGSEVYLVRSDSLGHTVSLCEEYNLPISVNNISVNDSNISVISIPFTVTTSVANTSTQGLSTSVYDGCVLDNIKELMAAQAAPLIIYPNPATNTVTIEITQAAVGNRQEAVSNIEIYDALGVKVYSTTNYKPSTTNNIDVSAFPNGVYVVQVKTEKGISVEKFIKE